MALPFCLNLTEYELQKVQLPGAIEIGDIDLIGALQPALAPLKPVFDIIDTIVALINCVKAIPDILGPPPNPQPLLDCFPELADKLGNLLMLLPQLSVPKMIKDIIRVITRSLENIQGTLISLQSQVQAILNAIDRATNLDDSGLMAIITCAQGNVATQQANTMQMLASLGRLFGLVNIFLGLIGLPELPDLSDLAGAPLDPLIELLTNLITLLETISDQIPLP